MTKFKLLAATAITAAALAGAANAQVITNVSISAQSRNQTAVAAYVVPAGGADLWTGGVVTAVGTTPAAIADAQYLLARETLASAQNLASSGTTTTTARYAPAGALGNNFLGPIAAGGGTFQVTLTLTGGRFQLPITAGNFTFNNHDGSANTPVNPLIVAGGNVNDTFVTLQFQPQAGTAGRATATSLASVTISHPFKVDAFNTNVSVSVNTAIVTAATDQPAIGTGTAEQRTRPIVNLVDGYVYTAGGAADAASGSNAFSNAVVQNADTIALPNFFEITGDGIGQVAFNRRGQTGANTIAFRGLTGQVIPDYGYTLRVNSLNGVFGTTVNSLRPGIVDGNAGTAGTGTVGAGNAFATFGTAGVPLTAIQRTVFINRGTTGSATAALATTDQRYELVITPQIAADNFIDATLLPARTYLAQNAVLGGASFIAPWVQSTNANYNTVIRVSNNGTAQSGALQLTLASPLNTPTATTCGLPAIAAGGEAVINSAALTTCFGNFGRGDVSVRVLSAATDLTAKLRIVSPGNVVSEQTLGRSIQ